jgi:hypothetical protein
MSSLPNATPSPPGFAGQVERLLTPAYAECFTDETRKVGNLLLLTSFVLILLDVGIVKAESKIELPVFSFSFTVTTGMGVILMAFCFCLLLLFAMRSYTEWKLWRLRHQAPMIEFLDLLAKIASSWQALTNQANSTLNSRIEVLRRVTELDLEAMQLERRRRTQEAARLEEIAAERRELDRELTESEGVDRSQTSAPEVKLLEAQLFYLHDALRPTGKILRIRFWWEMLFPAAFGALAIVLGIVTGFRSA